MHANEIIEFYPDDNRTGVRPSVKPTTLNSNCTSADTYNAELD